jgi:hypothetical protein
VSVFSNVIASGTDTYSPALFISPLPATVLILTSPVNLLAVPLPAELKSIVVLSANPTYKPELSIKTLST